MLLYHYTSIETLCAIAAFISEGRITLRANNHKKMNDPNDCRYFIEETFRGMNIENGKNDLLNLYEEYSNAYITSFSELKDDLHMWNCYGDNGHGIALGINSYYLQEFAQTLTYSRKISCLPHKCKYMRTYEIMKLYASTTLSGIGSDTTIAKAVTDIIVQNTNLVKHPCYSYEQEWRVVFSVNKKDLVKYPDLLYDKAGDFFCISIPLKEIKEIVVGPCANMAAIEKIFSPHLPGTDFLKSTVPFVDK